MTGDGETGRTTAASGVAAIRQRLQFSRTWAALALVLVGVVAFSLTVVNGQPLLPAVVNASAAVLVVAVVLLALGPFVGERYLAVAVHAVLGLFMTAIGGLAALLFYAEGALVGSTQTVLLGGLLLVGLVVLLAGGLLAVRASTPLGRVASIGLAATAVWVLGSLALVVLLTVEAGDVASEVSDEAVGLWVLFLALVILPGAVFWLDAQRSTR